MDGEAVHQPVQRRRLRLDIEVRRREPSPAQPNNQTSAHLPNDLVALIQNLSDPSISRRLGDERDGDLHLQASFGVEGKELLDDGENERARFGLVKMALVRSQARCPTSSVACTSSSVLLGKTCLIEPVEIPASAATVRMETPLMPSA